MKRLLFVVGVLLIWSANAYSISNHEYGLLVYTNAERQQLGKLPLLWNDGLAVAAKEKADEQAAHGGNCPAHDSCNGTVWWKRLDRYYPGWIALGENMASAPDDPRIATDGWMSSSGHRTNILNDAFVEAGAASSSGLTGFGTWWWSYVDFGSRGQLALSAYPRIIAATAVDNYDDTFELAMNYFGNSEAPVAIQAVVGGSCVPLDLAMGSKINGTWERTTRIVGCTSVRFESKSPSGAVSSWGPLSVNCNTAPVQNPACALANGGSPEPSPSPTPTLATVHLKTRYTTLRTVFSGYIYIQPDQQLINNIGIDNLVIPKECLALVGRGMKSICGPILRLSPAGIPRYRLRIVVDDLIPFPATFTMAGLDYIPVHD